MTKRRPYAARMPAGERRAQLLDAALHLIVTSGQDAVTMDALAERAGVSKPVIYGHFTGRAELLDALLHREQEQAMNQLLSVLPREGRDIDPGRDLADALDGFLRAVQESPDRWHCIVMPMPGMAAALHTAREKARAAVLTHVQAVAERLLRAADAPAEVDPEIAAQLILAIFETAARLSLTDPEHFRAERFVTTLRAAIGIGR